MAADIRVENLTVTADGASGSKLLQGINITFHAGRTTLITGANGAGKTTLLESIAGLRTLESGTVRYGDYPLWSEGKLQQRALLEFGIAQQRSSSGWFRQTIREELSYSMHPYKIAEERLEARMVRCLEEFGLEPAEQMLQREPWSLSGGQQRRLTLACLTAAEPSWLLLDEPTAGLDDEGISLLRRLLNRQAERGDGAVIITHDLDALWQVADDIVVLEDGRIREACSAAEWAERFSRDEEYAAEGVRLPESVRTAALLRIKRGELAGEKRMAGTAKPLSAAELAAVIARRVKDGSGGKMYEREAVTAAGDAGGQAYEAKSHSHLPVDKTTKLWERWSQRDPRALWLAYILVSFGLLIQQTWIGAVLGLGVAAAVAACLFPLVRPFRVLIKMYLAALVVTPVIAGLELNPPGFSLADAEPPLFRLFRLFQVMLLGLPLLGLMTPFKLQRAIEQSLLALRLNPSASRAIALMISLLFRFIPLLLSEWARFSKIAVARGKQAVMPGKVPIRMLHTVIIPYMHALLRMADLMSNSLEIRGFGNMKRVKRAVKLKLDRRDAEFIAAAAGVMLLLWSAALLQRFL
ncbi:ATP-binding cassette domain-containing protein [Paenibacillus tarimensis]|uniref:ATP-binding cassette domain-containing protein n=1 Tax=Paenibacillus tarimensis TaxID=416012 RepID=UPI001F168C9C|nr:ATP-binding cassette domain-containing protein [Paenibacillus tarimensis]MCF2942394.1 ATP-binding cassette domain-containing protein [Paenibacillus tarimensis]